MISTAVLLALLLCATYTDLRWRKIYNWTTYSGILIGLATSLIGSYIGIDQQNGTESQIEFYGIANWRESLSGLAACFGVMLVCYLFFFGGVGGGDVKLIAMIGAFVGIAPGIEVLLWTFVAGGCMALILLIWRYGLVWLVVRSVKFVLIQVRLGGSFELSEAERQPLQTDLFLSPSALLAYIIVRFQLLDWFS